MVQNFKDLVAPVQRRCGRRSGLRHVLSWLAIALATSGVTLSMARPSWAQLSIQAELVDTLGDLGGAEMLDVSSDGEFAVVVGGDTVTLVSIGSDQLAVEQTWSLSSEYFPLGSADAEITGVSISPDGSYVLIGVKDNDDVNLDVFQEVPGKVLALSLPELEVLGQVTVGRGPDSVAIAPNGTFAAVANEDEENEDDLTNPNNRPGSISIIDLRNGPASMMQVEVPIPPDTIPFFPNDPQPETVRISSNGRFILATLQENNAIARIEVPRRLPRPLSADAFTVTNFDAGLRTGSGLIDGRAGEGNCRSSSYDPSLRQSFTSAREPDGIALFPNNRYFVTADEDNLASNNNQSYDGIAVSEHGARSISVYNARTGEFLGDSGDTIEDSVIALQLPQRCSSKGPEPEVVSVGEVGGRVLAVVALERSDAVSIHDVTNPQDIRLLDTVILNPNVVGADESAELEPEGIEFIPQTNQILVSNPEGSSVSLINLTVD